MEITVTLNKVKMNLEISIDKSGYWEVEDVVSCENPLEFITSALTEDDTYWEDIEKQLPTANDYANDYAELKGEIMRGC